MNIKKQLSHDEMLDCLRNPTSNKRSLAELNTIIDEIIERNPDWVEQVTKIVERSRNERTN